MNNANTCTLEGLIIAAPSEREILIQVSALDGRTFRVCVDIDACQAPTGLKLDGRAYVKGHLAPTTQPGRIGVIATEARPCQ